MSLLPLILSLTCFAVVLQSVGGFVLHPLRPITRPSQLWGYRHEWGEGGGGEVDYGSEQNLQRPKARGLTVPVIGPIPTELPLMLGAEMTLDPPTLGQWQALEECVTLHQKYLKGANLTAIDAAPVVAIIDDYTGAPHDGKQRREIKRYATIAAVVGISPSKKKKFLEDERDFMEIMLGCKGRINPLSSRIRLVGVGRAELTDFFFQMPTALEENDLDDIECNVEGLTDEDVTALQRENQPDPIVMAEFRILNDCAKSSIHSLARIGDKGARSPDMAPVFAVNEMAKFSNKVTRLHDERRRLVNLIASAKTRLAEHNVFDDADGIGSIFIQEECLLDETEKLLRCDNYGLNYYSSFSSIPALTGVAQDVLESFYSPERRTTEEYRLEVLSFVAFRSLQGFCSPQDMAWALQCTNSIERLQRAYEIMLEHVWTLKKMAKEVSQDLEAHGEDFEGWSLDINRSTQRKVF